jgi:hypothetical protein
MAKGPKRCDGTQNRSPDWNWEIHANPKVVAGVARSQVVTRGQVAGRAKIATSQRGIATTKIYHIDEDISKTLVNEELEGGDNAIWSNELASTLLDKYEEIYLL